MDRNVDIKDFTKICRLCLACGNLQPFVKLKVLDTFSKITSIQVTNEDQLPENVCRTCVRQLDRISKFIQTCSNNDKLLRDIIQRSAEKECFKDSQSTDNDIKSESSDDDKNADTKDNQIFRDIKKEDEEAVQILETGNLNKDRPLSCNVCSQIFTARVGLLNHYRENLNCKPEGFTDDQNIVKYERDKTESDCNNEDDAEYDGKEPHSKGKKMFLCNFCGKNYTRKNGLDRHILSHTGVKPFECKECGKRYITKDTLKTHILTHTGIKPFKCQLCGKNFIQSSHLSYHMKRHQGERPFVCTYCGKCFVSNYHLERHKLMHTGVKPYQCKQCGKQDISQESNDGFSDKHPDYESNDLEVSANKSFEFSFEEEEPSIPYKANCNCSDLEYLEDKLDISEVKIEADISEKTCGIDLEGAKRATVNEECRRENKIIADLTSGEHSVKEVICNQTQNVEHPLSCALTQSASGTCSRPQNQEDEIPGILELERAVNEKEAVAADEMATGTVDFGCQTEVDVAPSNCDVDQSSLGGENEVTAALGTIFKKMPPDSASAVAMSDPLICEFALQYVKMCNSEITTMKKMRELAKLLIRVKMLEPSIKSLKDVFNPKHVAIIIYSLKILGKFNDKLNKYEKGAPVLSVGTSLKHCCKIYIRKAASEDKRKLIRTLTILQKTLPRSISSNNVGKQRFRIEKRAIKAEPGINAVSSQTTDNDDINSSGNDCVVGGNELTIFHEIKKEKEVISVFEEIKHESQSMDAKRTGDVILENQMSIDYRNRKVHQDRPTFCFICKKTIVQFSRHLRRRHSEEPEVKEILSLPLGDRQRKVLTTKLRNRWNFFGYRANARHLNDNMNTRILPCSNCLGFYTARYLVRHKQKCGSATEGRRHRVHGQNLLIKHHVDPLLFETVFQRMLPDGVSFVAKNDPLVCDFALEKLKTKKIDAALVSISMRKLAKLIIHVRTLDQSVKELRDILKPKYFDIIISALKILAKFNEKLGKYQTPQFVRCLERSLKRCCEIVIAEKSTENVQEVRDMLEILHSRWPNVSGAKKRKISSLSAHEKRQKVPKLNGNRRCNEIWTEEQKKAVRSFFAKHIQNKKNVKLIDCKNIKNLHPTLLGNKDWKKIKSLVQYERRKASLEKSKEVSATERAEMLCTTTTTKEKVDVKKADENVSKGTVIQDKDTKEHLFAANLYIYISKEDRQKADDRIGITSSKKNGANLLFAENKFRVKYEMFSVKENEQNFPNICYGERGEVSLQRQSKTNNDSQLIDTILLKMAPDEVALAAQNDSLIRTFALDYLKTDKLGKISILSRKMRELAELLLLSRNTQPSLVNLIDILNPNNLYIIIETLTTMGEYDDKLNRLRNHLIVASIRESLIKCCEIVIREETLTLHVIHDCLVLIDILKTQWPKFVPINDTTQVTATDESLLLPEKETLTPSWTEEQRKLVNIYFAGHIEHRIQVGEFECSRLKKLYPDLLANKTWASIREFVQNGYRKAPESGDFINRESALSSGTCNVDEDVIGEVSSEVDNNTIKMTDILSLPLRSEDELSKVGLQRQAKTNNDSQVDANCPRSFRATQLIDGILLEMAPDEVALAAQNDSLIRTFALDYLETHELGNISILSRKMRELAEFLVLSRNSHPSLVNLIDVLKPNNLYIIIETLKSMGRYDDKLNKLGNSLDVSSIRESLIKCCEIIREETLTLHVIYDCIVLIDILKTQWPNFFAINDTTQVAASGESLKLLEEETLMPSWTEEQRKLVKIYFARHIENKIQVSELECSGLKKLYPDLLANKTWESIRAFVQKEYRKTPESGDFINRESALSSETYKDGTYNAKDKAVIGVTSGEIGNVTIESTKADVNTIKDVVCEKDADLVSDSFEHIQKVPGGDEADDDSIIDRTGFEMKQETKKQSMPKIQIKHFCFICKKEVADFSRHMQRHHSESPELKEIFLLPRESSKRKVLLKELRDTWTTQHLLSSGTSDRKCQVPEKYSLVPCAVDPLLEETVFQHMRTDYVYLVARNDPLICKVALHYLKVLKSRSTLVTRKIRELAQLLILMKKLEPSISNLRDILRPIYFEVIIRAVKQIGKFNDALDRFENGTKLFSIRGSLKNCCNIIVGSEELTSDESDVFKEFLKRDWPKFVPPEEVGIRALHGRTPWTKRQKKVVRRYFTEHMKHNKSVNEAECTKLKDMYPNLLADKDWTKIKSYLQFAYRNKPKLKSTHTTRTQKTSSHGDTNVSEAFFPQEGDVQRDLSLGKGESNEKGKSTEENDIHSRLEIDDSRADAPKTMCLRFLAGVSPAVKHIDNSENEVSCVDERKRILIRWTDEQKQVVKAFFADNIKHKKAVKEDQCLILKSLYPELLANKDWKKIKFVRSTTLRDHLLAHSGEKPFVCQHCGKQFNRKQSLTNHVLIHTGRHNETSVGVIVIS
nr:unnamed protein product [Callosobruchus chinensis]